MNEKLINSLMWKAGARFEMMNWVHYDDFDYEKFAQLIVEECMNRVSKWNTFYIDENDKIHHSNIADDINKDLRKHFGVK